VGEDKAALPVDVLVVRALLDDSTVNTMKFREVLPGIGKERSLGVVYMQKRAWNALGQPVEVEFTVTVVSR